MYHMNMKNQVYLVLTSLENDVIIVGGPSVLALFVIIFKFNIVCECHFSHVSVVLDDRRAYATLEGASLGYVTFPRL